VESILEEVRRSEKAEGSDRIYIHGEKEMEKRAESMAEGITLDDATWKLFDDYAAKFGLEKLSTPALALQTQ
jgi:LDH2 family malate/lactate/ureidoglycolate dehydrogenase